MLTGFSSENIRTTRTDPVIDDLVDVHVHVCVSNLLMSTWSNGIHFCICLSMICSLIPSQQVKDNGRDLTTWFLNWHHQIIVTCDKKILSNRIYFQIVNRTIE